MKPANPILIRRSKQRVAFFALLVLGLTITPRVPVSVATPVGILYTSPESSPVLPVNSVFNLTIKVADMGEFNGWDIQVVTEPVINAIKLSDYQVTPNTLIANTTGGIPFEITHCVNGVGTGCTPNDGPGIVHSAFGDTKSTSGSGFLFTITYNVTSNSPYSPIVIQDDSFSSSSTTGVAHSTIEGAYGTPDFTLISNAPSMTVFQGSSNSSKILLASFTFAGSVNLTAVSLSNLLKVSLSQEQVRLAPSGTASVVLTATADSSIPASLYRVRVTATNGTILHSREIDVHIPANPDFQIGASPDELRTHAGDSNATTIIVKSENGFAGLVNLTLQVPPGTVGSLSMTTLTISQGGEANATLSFTSQTSFTRFRDSFNVTGTSGPISHTIDVIDEPPPPDFRITADQISASVQAGESKVLTIGLTSLDYYAGTIYLVATAKSGVTFSLDSSRLYLNISQTALLTLRVQTNTTTSPGNHTINVAALDVFSTRHEINITLAVLARPQTPSQPRQIFGLQPAVYFGTLGVLGVLLAFLGVRESRIQKKKERRFLQG